MSVCTRRLYENRAAVQIGAATSVMHGYWMTMAELFDCRAILVRAELASHRRAVEVRYHDAQGHNTGQAVRYFQNRHGGAIPFA
jgi:arginine/ornithine N-succinyltransferase beta subunit